MSKQKQLIIYNDIAPLSSEKHLNWSVEIEGKGYEFASEANSVPLMAAEFASAALEYPIVFAGKDEKIAPIVMLGLKNGSNLYLQSDGTMDALYVPAFLRRYPFILSTNEKQDNFVMCIDEEFKGFNEEGKGERLFDSQGEQTEYLKNKLKFLSECQSHVEPTNAFCKKLVELDLLKPIEASFSLPEGEKSTVTGFMAIDRQKLNALSAEQCKELMTTGELELIYIHLQSLNNFHLMVEKAGTKQAA